MRNLNRFQYGDVFDGSKMGLNMYHKEEEEQMFKSKLNDLDVKDDNLSILPSSDFFENL